MEGKNASRRDCEGSQRPVAEGNGVMEGKYASRRDCERFQRPVAEGEGAYDLRHTSSAATGKARAGGVSADAECH